MHNPEKRGFLDVPLRVKLLETACRDIPNVQVMAHGGLLITCAHEVGAQAVVRGLRPIGDFESEYQMAQINRQLGGVETLFLTTSDNCASISSSMSVRSRRSAGISPRWCRQGTATEILAALDRAKR